MGTERDYADLVERAKKAVAAVEDPELKKVAFERVVDDLAKKETIHTVFGIKVGTERDYGGFVVMAEKAVATVKDPEPKGIAFRKVLDHALRFER